MKIAELISQVTIEEGGVTQATVADVRQVFSKLRNHLVTNPEAKLCFQRYVATLEAKINKTKSKKQKRAKSKSK